MKREVINDCVSPQDARRKVAKIVASKCTLAARVDSSHQNPSGDFGEGKEAPGVSMAVGCEHGCRCEH